MMNKLGLYVHIPFCLRKCRYCDFLSFDDRPHLFARYIGALKAQIGDEAADYGDHEVVSIYLGGGTPSFAPYGVIGELLDLIGASFAVRDDAEISIEVNPGSVDRRKLDEYRSHGINRLSIGLQSASDKELAVLGRIHTMDDFLASYDLARSVGFDNINIDLISAIPGQSVESWRESLIRTAELGPEHISAYSLQLEEETYLYEHRDEYEWPGEDADREMYHLTAQILREAGYHRYEISNYSKPGYECRHNTIYWQGGDYLGLGLGAASLITPVRFKNTDNIEEYLRGIRCVWNSTLSESDMMEEFMFLGLRMTDGVSREAFEKRFGRSADEVYGDVFEKCVADGLICSGKDNIRLTELGLDVSNYVFAKFLLGEG